MLKKNVYYGSNQPPVLYSQYLHFLSERIFYFYRPMLVLFENFYFKVSHRVGTLMEIYLRKNWHGIFLRQISSASEKKKHCRSSAVASGKKMSVGISSIISWECRKNERRFLFLTFFLFYLFLILRGLVLECFWFYGKHFYLPLVYFFYFAYIYGMEWNFPNKVFWFITSLRYLMVACNCILLCKRSKDGW